MNESEKRQAVRELVRDERLTIFVAHQEIEYAGCAVRDVEMRDGKISVWIEECACHEGDDHEPAPDGWMYVSGDTCRECGCDMSVLVRDGLARVAR